MLDSLERSLRHRYGIDIAFDAQSCRDAVADDADFVYVDGVTALQEELERLFTVTPGGSFIDDGDYGINTDWIGTSQNPEVATTLARVEILRALEHPSFATRFQVRRLEVRWNPQIPNALSVSGVLECFGFEGVPLFSFGPYAIKYLLSNANN